MNADPRFNHCLCVTLPFPVREASSVQAFQCSQHWWRTSGCRALCWTLGMDRRAGSRPSTSGAHSPWGGAIIILCDMWNSNPEKGEKLGSWVMVLRLRNSKSERHVEGLTAEEGISWTAKEKLEMPTFREDPALTVCSFRSGET